MKKRILKYGSYFFPITVLETDSEYHDLLKVQWCNGKKMLNSKRANYSYGTLHSVFKYGLSKHKIKLTSQDSVLILGFGAGSVKSILRKDLNFKGQISGVEIDKKIFELAKEHFNIPNNSSSQFSVIIEDAFQFIEKNDEKFKLIVVDLFYDLSTPERFLKSNFIAKLSLSLQTNGKILFNIIGQNQLEKLKMSITDNQLKYKVHSTTKYDVTNHLILINK